MASSSKRTSPKEDRQKSKLPRSPSTEEAVSQPVTEAPVSAADAGSPTAALAEESLRKVEDAHGAEMAGGNVGQAASPVASPVASPLPSNSRGTSRKSHRQKARAPTGLPVEAPSPQPVTTEAAAAEPVAAQQVTAQPDRAEPDTVPPVAAQAESVAETAIPATAVADEIPRQIQGALAVDVEPPQTGPPLDVVISIPTSHVSPSLDTGKEARTTRAWRDSLPFFSKVAVALLWHIYLATAIALTWNSAPNFCHDIKFLTLVTCIAYPFILWQAVNALLGKKVDHVRQRISNVVDIMHNKIPALRPCLWLSAWICIALFVMYDASYDRYRITSLNGIVILILIGYAFSNNRACVSWHPVMWGLMLQFLLGLCVLRWSTGREALRCLSAKMEYFLRYTTHGSFFVFGHLASGWNLTDALGDLATLVPPREGDVPKGRDIKPLLPVFVFNVLPVIFFFSMVVNILYFYGIMQWVVLRLGGFLQLTMGTTVCESTVAAANICLGQTEAPLVVRPFLSKMTKSELHAVITGGFATVAGGMLAAYISFGVSSDHLITASIMSAPAALACAKLVYPETEESLTQIKNIEPPKCEETNALQAASNGAVIGLCMAGNIVANLVGFLALIACLNSLLLWFGSMVAIDYLSFEWVLSKTFTPLAFIMGVPWRDCGLVGELIGIKTFANEFIAYSRLATVMTDMERRSVVIATYALCGFSNVGSIGIALGALGAMAPDRKSDCASVAVRALFSGSMACFLTACVAGTLTA